MLLAITLCILVSCTKTTTSFPTLTRRPRSYIFDFTRNPQKRSPASDLSGLSPSSEEISNGKQLLAQYLGQPLVRRRERSDGNVPLVAPVVATRRRRSRKLKNLFSYLVNSISRGPTRNYGHINTPLMPPPVSSPPADSHVLRTRASPSATTNAMDYGEDDPMPPPPPLGMAGGGMDDRKIVCKFAPYRRCYRMDEDGKLQPMRRAQPVNILRVYKRGGRGGRGDGGRRRRR